MSLAWSRPDGVARAPARARASRSRRTTAGSTAAATAAARTASGSRGDRHEALATKRAELSRAGTGRARRGDLRRSLERGHATTWTGGAASSGAWSGGSAAGQARAGPSPRASSTGRRARPRRPRAPARASHADLRTGAEARTDRLHPLAGVADHRHLEHASPTGRVDRPATPGRRRRRREVLADPARLDVDRVEVLPRGEEHLALPARPRVRAALETVLGDRAGALVPSIRPLFLAGEVQMPLTVATRSSLAAASAPLVERDCCRRSRRSGTRPRRPAGSWPRASHAATTSAGSPSRSAPRTKVARSSRSSSASGVPAARPARSAGRELSSKRPSGTRKTAPAEARSALGPVGSAQPRRECDEGRPESVRQPAVVVPTLPGSPTCQRASPTAWPAGRRPAAAGPPCGRRRGPAVDDRALTPPRAGAARPAPRSLSPGSAGCPLGVDERLDGLQAGIEGRRDQVFALTTEQSQPLPLPAAVQASQRGGDVGCARR